MNGLMLRLTLLILAVTAPDVALAYVGPGAGLSAIGTVVAVVGAFLLLIVGFVWYPVKRIMRSRKAKANSANNPASVNSEQAESKS